MGGRRSRINAGLDARRTSVVARSRRPPATLRVTPGRGAV